MRSLLLPSLILIPAFVSILQFLEVHWLPHQYVFSPAKLQEISRKQISIHGNNTLSLMQAITEDLRTEYGDAIVPWTTDDWFFNNAGGAMGTMVLLHASLTEYLIFFGTPLSTEGHSGVHLADDYFTILVGEEHAAAAGELTPRVYGPGDQNHLRRGDAIQYHMPEACFALELAQGWILGMIPFGFADTFTSTFDFKNLWKTARLTVSGMTRQALRGKF